MEFGRPSSVELLDELDLSLPRDDDANAASLSLFRLPDAPRRVWMGAPVWAQPALARRLGPPGTKGRRALATYARHFDALELNTTFYAAERAQLERWASAVPAGFRFAPKLLGAIGHERRLVGAERESEAFFSAVEGLGTRRGPCWLLLPPDFGPSELSALARWLERFAARGPLAVELRDPGWFADRGAAAAVFELFEAHGVGAVISDVALRRDVLHMRVSAPFTFVRFAGHALHPTDLQRLDQWIERLGAWFEAGLREAWLCLHQPNEGLVVELAQFVADAAPGRLGLELRRPDPLESARQPDLFG
ncbi:DUF72 domain-containing protein [Engelhardtia mirabilis]|uniref:DUF72 domain-containing protein n=1 Tax=Engelhardtia mirabilis TaxID=2528011 RepID=A0A518BKT1_9BACT|nr:hypothetical protein Pla133_26660 [Planctomycetes bacterium Pla133]QDV01904.1 hypothetical protein Pla86_26650 [Planctomycetes bacterium Pla86]